MLKRVLKAIQRAVRDTPTNDIRGACNADTTTVFLNTARVIPNGFPPDRICIGAHTRVKGELTLFGHGGRITVGEWCFIGEQSRLWSGREITIGDRVLISHQVSIMDNLTHPVDAKERAHHFKAIFTKGHPTDIDLDDKPVNISDDVWIGCNSVILRGVSIGERSIVAAGSVVTRDVPPDVIVAGNPAKIIKKITPSKG